MTASPATPSARAGCSRLWCRQQIEARAKASGKTVKEEEIALLSEKQPMHQFTKPESIGALTVFLASDAAATITGSAYSIDGGWVAQ